MTSGALEYEADGETMIGRLALPAGDGLVPGVLIAHGAPGLDDYSRTRPDALALAGYAALALDYHGGGRVYSDPAELVTRLDEIGSRGRLRALGRAGLSLSWSWPGLERISRQSSTSTLAWPRLSPTTRATSQAAC